MKNIVNFSEYPYGRIHKRLKDVARWLNANQNNIKRELAEGKFDIIDYPDYWGIPTKLSKQLDTDEVDFLQDQTFRFFVKNHKE